jgi:alpha-beta hydrolase superfamily lysophospholipase
MRRDIQFYSDGSLIRGHLYLPEGAKSGDNLPCLILCHGFAGFKELLLPVFAQSFSENGFASLTFDYRGFGESEGVKGQLDWRKQVQDIRNAVTFVETLSEANPGKIGLWGTSYGGANVIETAAQDHRAQCLVVQLSFGDGERVITAGQTTEQKEKLFALLTKAWQRETQKGKPMMLPIDNLLTDAQSRAFFSKSVSEFPLLESKISISFLRHTLEYRPEKRLKDVYTPILVVGADRDEVNQVSESHSLYGQAQDPKSLHIVKGAGHYEVYEGKYFEEVFAVELEWFKKHLL